MLELSDCAPVPSTPKDLGTLALANRCESVRTGANRCESVRIGALGLKSIATEGRVALACPFASTPGPAPRVERIGSVPLRSGSGRPKAKKPAVAL